MATTRRRRVTALVAKSLEAGKFPVSFHRGVNCAPAVPRLCMNEVLVSVLEHPKGMPGPGIIPRRRARSFSD